MLSAENKNELFELISQNKLNKAFVLLEKYIPRESEYFNHFILLRSRWNHMTEEKRLGLLTYEQISLTRNKLMLSMMDVIEDVYSKNNESKEVKSENIDQIIKGSLSELNLSNRKLKELPESLKKKLALTNINLSNNNFSTFPPELKDLKNLEFIDLSNNNISFLPNWVSDFSKLKKIRLENNNFNLPSEIYSKSAGEIIEIIKKIQTEEKARPINECKLIVIGSGGVGKTSLINMIVENRFNPDESKTDGIEIKKWGLKIDGKKIRINVWDFGGQEIMHATHKFFMTKRSIYLLVVNARIDDKYGDDELNYWLKLINSYSPVSPIIVAINKSEVHKSDYGIKNIMAKYESIIDFCETSCVNNTGLDSLERLIVEGVKKLNHLDEKLPSDFYLIRNELESINDAYMHYSDYIQLCERITPNSDEKQLKTYIRLFNDLGIMLNISENRRLENTQVLNPEWITNGVYSIVNSPKLIENKGIISEDDLLLILDPQLYPTSIERGFIMDMMENFELCYQVPDKRNFYFIPGAFPKDKPDELDWMNKDNLQFVYKFDVLPSSVISRFIVKIHPFIIKNNFWRNGVIINHHHEKNKAIVYKDQLEKLIIIKIEGKGNKRTTLSYIRTEFEKIFRSINQLKVEGMIPVGDNFEIYIKYDDLIAHEEMGEDYIIVPELREKFEVRVLLEGLEERLKPQELKSLIAEGKIDEALKKLYKYFENDNEVIAQLSRLKRLRKEVRLNINSNQDKELNKITSALLDLIDEILI